MFEFRIKWRVAIESAQVLDQKFAGKDHCVTASPFGEVLWVRTEDTLYAYKNKCPHQNKPLNDCHIQGGYIICPFHKYHFSLENGRGHGTSMFRFDVKIEDGKIWLGKEVFSLF